MLVNSQPLYRLSYWGTQILGNSSNYFHSLDI
jgi:hypothetical protein